MENLELKQKLKEGDLVLGTLIVSTSPFWPKILKDCSLDFIFIDTEHIAISRETLSWMCRTYSAMGLPPLVRMKSPDQYIATQFLDDGAAGIISPYTETVAQVKDLVGSTKKRPLKGNRLDHLMAGNDLEKSLNNYVNKFNDNNLLVLNIESKPAVENLDHILEIEGIDAIQIGPHDLTTSLGIPEEYDNIIYLNTVETIFKKARSKSVGAGIHAWGTPEYQKRLLDMGANMLIHKADAIFFKDGLENDLNEIRSLVGSNIKC
jgi:4-hydroxy-2-oxoheptanedioate aldolase